MAASLFNRFPLTRLFLSLSLSVWCVNTHALRFDRLTRIHGENTPKPLAHVTRIRRATLLRCTRSRDEFKTGTDLLNFSHACRRTTSKHTAYKPTYCRFSVRNPKLELLPLRLWSIKQVHGIPGGQIINMLGCSYDIIANFAEHLSFFMLIWFEIFLERITRCHMMIHFKEIKLFLGVSSLSIEPPVSVPSVLRFSTDAVSCFFI